MLTFLWFLAIITTTIFTLKLILMAFSGFIDDVHFDTAHGHDIGNSDGVFKSLSINTVLCFLMSFCWITLAGIKDWGFSIPGSLLLGVAAGFVMSFFLNFILVQLRKIETERKPIIISKGEKALVYRAIPAGGLGEINIMNKFFKATANDAIPSFSKVEVVEQATENEVIKVKKTI